MNKVKDISGDFYRLLQFARSQWFRVWENEVKYRHPTLYGLYLKNLAISTADEIQYIRSLSRKRLDRLSIRWQNEKGGASDPLLRIAGSMYRKGCLNFGFFLFVGFERQPVTVVETKKGKAILCDLWFLKGDHSDGSSRSIYQMDDDAALFAANDKRV